MKKISLFFMMSFVLFLGFSFADKLITLQPGWNVVSTPQVLSGIIFSNDGIGISFYTLSGNSRISTIPTVQTVKPLEGFVVNNSTDANVTMNLIYKTDVSPMETLFQKTLQLGRNILGITTITNPFTNIGSSAVMSIDFTKNNSVNLVNGINSSYEVNSTSSSVTVPQLGEAYGIFVSSLGAIYGGSQNADSSSGDDDSNTGLILQMTNSSISTKNIQRGDGNIELADLEFSTPGDEALKIYSFKADITGCNWNMFDGGQITVYGPYSTALVSDTIISGDNQLTFILPSALNISKAVPAIFTLKLDQVPNTVNTGNTLQLLFATGDVNAKEIINMNAVYPTTGIIGSLLTVIDPTILTIVSQSFTPALVKLNGLKTTIATLKFKPFNGDVVLKDLTLTGADTTPFSKVVLKDGETEIATFIKMGTTGLWIDSINKTLTMDVTKTYSVEATLKNATTSTDIITGYAITLVSANFESLNGAAIVATTVPATVGSTMKFVKAKPTISLVSLTRVGNNAVYKFTIIPNGGDIKLSSITFTIINNTDTTGSFLTGTLWLGNEGQTSLGVIAANGTAAFHNLSGNVEITDGETRAFTLVVPISNWYIGINHGNIGIEVANISYFDTFSDATVTLHAAMFDTYKWDIAPITTSAFIE